MRSMFGGGSNYPPGVTGNEPEIAGTPYDDKCRSCCETDAPISAIPEGVIDTPDEGLLCLDCFEAWCEENELNFPEIESAIIHRYTTALARAQKEGTDG